MIEQMTEEQALAILYTTSNAAHGPKGMHDQCLAAAALLKKFIVEAKAPKPKAAKSDDKKPV